MRDQDPRRIVRCANGCGRGIRERSSSLDTMCSHCAAERWNVDLETARRMLAEYERPPRA